MNSTEYSDDVFQASLPSRGASFAFSTSHWLDHIAGIVRNEGLAVYEAPFPDIICCLVRQIDGIVLDVGANTGLFTLLAASSNPNIKVCSFEPLPKIAEKLDRNLSLNATFAGRVARHRIGLSNVKGTFDFYEHINQHGLVSTSSSLEMSHTEAVGAEHIKTTIDTDTLDNFCDRMRSPIEFIKIDVEGHEYAVIQGGRAVINRDRPIISVEILEPSDVGEIKRMIFEENYLDFVISPGTLKLCDSLRFHSDGWNHLLCPVEKVGQILQVCRQVGLSITFA